MIEIHHPGSLTQRQNEVSPPIIIYRQSNARAETTTVIALQESGKPIFPGGKLITDESPEDFEDDHSLAQSSSI